MLGLTQEEERFKVLLVGIEEDSDEHRETFCREVSKKYHLSLPLLRDVIDRCPIVLRKNIPLKKAEALARTLKQFGALVSIEGSGHWPPIRLEFVDLGPAVVALEDSCLRKRQNGMWSVTGKVKNVSAADVVDLWVLVQLFGPDDELITFEEVPIPINPLPPRTSSPFKILFEGSAWVRGVSIAFKSAGGVPLSSTDTRQVKGRTPETSPEEDPVEFSDTHGLRANPEEAPADGTSTQSTEDLPSETSSSPQGDVQGSRQDAEVAQPPEAVSSPQDTPGSELQPPAEPPVTRSQARIPPDLERRDVEMIGIVFPELDTSSLEKTGSEGAPEASSPLEEASQILGEISNEGHGPRPQMEMGLTMEMPEGEHAKQISPSEEESLAPPWIELFQHSVEAFYRHHPNPFGQWFQGRREGKGFENKFHALVTILLHARFDQMTSSAKALENTERVYLLVMRPSLAVDDIPAIEGIPPIPAEQWRMLLHKAIPRLCEVAQHVMARPEWSAADLEQLLQVIPHMGPQTSRRATREIRALMADAVRIDFSQVGILIGEPLYRVAARLGIVDPQFDVLENPVSMGDVKIQSFAKTAFPEDWLRIEEPMEWVGSPWEEDGLCTPLHPRCEACLFEEFCPRLHTQADPCEKRRRKEN